VRFVIQLFGGLPGIGQHRQGLRSALVLVMGGDGVAVRAGGAMV
jgi:hypothetical protein